MTSNVLFETLDSSKRSLCLQLESNCRPHACQFAALTTRPFVTDLCNLKKFLLRNFLCLKIDKSIVAYVHWLGASFIQLFGCHFVDEDIRKRILLAARQSSKKPLRPDTPPPTWYVSFRVMSNDSFDSYHLLLITDKRRIFSNFQIFEITIFVPLPPLIN